MQLDAYRPFDPTVPAPAAPTAAEPVAEAAPPGWLERATLVYLVAISAGVFGVVDILAFGDAYDKTSASPFAQALWPIAYLLTAALVLTHAREVIAATRRSWWLLLFPAAAALSILWTIDPEATLGGAVRITATTVIGIWLGTRFEAGAIARAVFAVLLLAVLASVLTFAAGSDFATMSDGAVRGVFHHKNTLGGRAALLVIAALALLLAGWRPWLAAPGLALGLTVAALSSSAAGLALAAIATVSAPFILALVGSGTGVAFRVALIGVLVSLAAFVVVSLGIDPIAAGLEALGRDATLTGRLLLWEVALAQIGDHPWLGVGFDAFWASGVDWRTLVVLSELGNVLHFHNSFLEVGVQLGWLGLSVAFLTCLGYAVLALRALRHRLDPAPLWPALFGVGVLGLAMVEVELFVQHNLMHILFVAIPVALASAAERRRDASQGETRWP